MAFVQIIEFRASDLDAVKQVGEEYEEATKGKSSARRIIRAQDHNDPKRLFNLVFFDSYESAMENSNLPETDEIAQKMAALAEGPPTFYDLDILEERTI